MTDNKECNKWNVVINKTTAGTVSQEKIDQLRKSITDNPEIREGIWNIELTKDSPDSDYAKYLMLIHETLEEEDLEMNVEDCEKL